VRYASDHGGVDEGSVLVDAIWRFRRRHHQHGRGAAQGLSDCRAVAVRSPHRCGAREIRRSGRVAAQEALFQACFGKSASDTPAKAPGRTRDSDREGCAI
jgi:hypothetical protein